MKKIKFLAAASLAAIMFAGSAGIAFAKSSDTNEMHQDKMGFFEKFKAKIDAFLANGAGKSGKVPPGLLKAPGIQKKLGDVTKHKSDTTDPVISNISAANVGSTTARVSWATNEKSSSTLWYGTTTPLNLSTAQKITDKKFRTAHTASLTDLSTSTVYYYKIEVKDAAGNTATSTEYSFTTAH